MHLMPATITPMRGEISTSARISRVLSFLHILCRDNAGREALCDCLGRHMRNAFLDWSARTLTRNRCVAPLYWREYAACGRPANACCVLSQHSAWNLSQKSFLCHFQRIVHPE